MESSTAVQEHHLQLATALADASRRMITQHRTLNVALKPDRSFVTQMDISIETMLRSMIHNRFPSHGIIGEEQRYENEDAEYVWILDPIDGTASFIAGMPVYSTLIALAYQGTPILGIMDFPAIHTRWVGVHGRPTLKNGVPCRVKTCPDLSRSMMSTSNPDFYSDTEQAALDLLRRNTNWRIYGAAALAYGLLSEGGTDLAIDAGLKIYDYAPFRPIIEGAGGTITDWHGQPITLATGSRILAAGDPNTHSQILQMLENLNIPANMQI